MDELILDDKKYVSSKRAAKITGYAKDYIGQLCREGRVNARLVGRSWYVLESAIHDHRFGEKADEKPAAPSAAVFSSTWSEPKYEATAVEDALPSAPEEVPAPTNTAEHLQESWKAWFDRVGEPSEAPIEDTVEANAAPEPVEEAVSVPIRAIHHEQYQPLPHEILSRGTEIREEDEREEPVVTVHPARSSKRGHLAIQLAGTVLALVMVGLAVAGSGYVDHYVLSNKNLGLLAGVNLYNR